MRHATILILAILLIICTVSARKGRKRSRWDFQDKDSADDVVRRRGNKSGKRNKSMLGSLFTADKSTGEVIDLDAIPKPTEGQVAAKEFRSGTAEEVSGAVVDLDEQPIEEVMSSSIPKPRQQSNINRPEKNPCQDFLCEEGEECTLDSAWKPSCVCRSSCYEPKPEEKVCTNFNETFPSRCHVYKEKCLCKKDSSLCAHKKNKEVHIEYNAACRELARCEEDQLVDFPRRMREWLFNVMKDYAERQVLQLQFLELEEQAEKNENPWVNAVLWKFCDLDVDPEDRFIDRHELIRIKAPIIPMEQCIIPFLDQCDVDSNHMITLKEWGQCLTLDGEQILDICDKSKPL